jgi:hypothetical protein
MYFLGITAVFSPDMKISENFPITFKYSTRITPRYFCALLSCVYVIIVVKLLNT